MNRSLTLCAATTLIVGLSVPATAVAAPVVGTDAVTQATAFAGAPQGFAASRTAIAYPVARDAFDVEQIVKEIVAVSSAGGSTGGTFTGSLVTWPASAGVNDGFGYRDGGEFHKGIDIMAGYGSSIVSAAAGTVRTVSEDGGWGAYVEVDHGGGISTLYAHMISGSAVVSEGQSVAAGEMLGSVGDTGYVTVAHLHFEVHVGGSPVDPMGWLP